MSDADRLSRQLGRAMKPLGLTIAQRFAAQALLSYRNAQTGLTIPGKEAIEDITGIAKDDQRKLFKALEAAGILTRIERPGRSNSYTWPLFEGRAVDPRVHSPGEGQGPQGEEPGGGAHNPTLKGEGPQPPGGRAVGPRGVGPTAPPNSLNSITPAAAAAESLDANTQPGTLTDPAIVILRTKLDAAGLAVRWDTLTPPELHEIRDLVLTRTDAVLVQAALTNRAAHDSPPVYARAWLNVWRSLPQPGARHLAAVGPARCNRTGHRGQLADSCELCDGQRRALPAPANWRDA